MLPKTTSGAARKRIAVILGTLLAVNAAVAHILTTQLAAKTTLQQVKDEQVVVEEASELPLEGDASGEDDGLPQISIYTVQEGDTISGIAEKFGIRWSTILWANKLTTKSTLSVGDTLVILPIDGVTYTVAKGDTISGIAKKFRVGADEILSFNNIDDPRLIKPGLELVIPEAEPLPATPAKPTSSTKSTSATSTRTSVDSTPPKKSGNFTHPAPGSVLTQALHAVNAVDLGAPVGTPILAADGGTVIVAKGTGAYNGGFGNFIVINHGNGIQTLYAHLSKVQVSVGDTVDQGEQIGLMGSTGKSTGSHLHFEVHGGINPYARDKKYSQY